MSERKRGFFGRLLDRGENVAKSTKRDVVEGLTLLPRATVEGIREGLAQTRAAGEHERTVMNWELVILGGMIVGALVMWWLLHLLKLGGLGMILAGIAAVIYFNRLAREKLRGAISRWIRAKESAAGVPAEAGGSHLSPELLREMALSRLARIQHRLKVWDDLSSEERRASSLAVLAAVLDDLTLDGRIAVAQGVSEGPPEAAAVGPDTATPSYGTPLLPESRAALERRPEA